MVERKGRGKTEWCFDSRQRLITRKTTIRLTMFFFRIKYEETPSQIISNGS